MFKSLQRHITLWIKSKTGLSSGLMMSWAAAVAAVVMVFVFLCVSAYAWLSAKLGPVFGGLAMAGAFLVVAVIEVAVSALAQRQTKKWALLEQAVHVPGPAALADPAVLRVVMQAGRALGWQRILPMALLGFLAAQWAQEARHRYTTDRVG